MVFIWYLYGIYMVFNTYQERRHIRVDNFIELTLN